MPSRSQPRSPSTPPRGSSPVTPPGGSAPRSNSRPGPAPIRPPAQPLSPLATRLAQQRLRSMATQPPIAPPAPRPTRPPGQSAPTPQYGPPVQSRPAPVAIGQTPQAFPGLNVADITPNTQNNFAPPGLPTPDPRGLFGPQGRFAEASARINAPAYEEFPAPSTTGIDPTKVIGASLATPPQGATVRVNDDGTEDWATVGPNGQTVYTPKTRQTEPSLLQRATRAVGQGVWMGLEALGLPAKGTERVVGSATQRTAQIEAPITLPNGRVYTPASQAVIPGFVASASGVKRPFAGNDLVAAALQTYGDTGPVRDAISETTRIAYSGPEAQLRAIGRILDFGQAPDLALYGDGGYVTDVLVPLGYLDDKLGAIKADPLANYVYENWKANEGYTDEQFIELLETQGLPGEQNIHDEMVGQVVLDPLNIVPDFVKPMLEADWAKRAAKLFTTRTNRDAAGIIASEMRGTIATGLPLVDKVGNFLFGRTPTSVKNRILTAGGDALSFALKAVDDLGAKGSKYTVLKAAYDFAEAAPVRLAGQTDEAFALATAAWRSSVKTAQHVLEAQAPMLLSDAGKLGGALVRKLLQAQDGTMSTKLLSDIAAGGKPYEIMAALMGKLDEAAEALLMPERAGARNVAEFVANTGRKAQDFPVFERGLAGASERVRLEASAALAKANPKNAEIAGQLDYKAGNLAHLVAGFDSARHWVNSGLWNLFAKISPAYSARNAMNNVLTAMVDGNLTFDNMAAVEDFLHVLGDPSAAAKGIGSGEIAARTTKPLAGGFAGFMRSTDLPLIGKPLKRLGVDIPLGAQAVEEAISKRIVYAAAKRFLDRTMVLGKAIPDLPPSLATALGDDVTRQLVQHLAATYGDVEGAFKLAEKLRGGVSELWRIPADEHLAAMREFGGDLARKLDALLTGDEFKTADGIRAGMARLRREVAEQLQVAERNIPTAQAMTGEVGEAFAEDTRVAAEAGVDHASVTGMAPQDFEARLAAEQNAQQVAQGRAFEALKRSPDQQGFAAFAEVQERVTEGGRKTTERVKELRTAAWERTTAIRSMNGLTPDARGHMIRDVWADYFRKRDQLWTSYRQRAMKLWDDLGVQLGGELMAVPSLDDMANAFVPSPWTGKVKVDAKNERDYLKSLARQLDPASPEAQRLTIRINELAADPKAYFKQYGYQGSLVAKPMAPTTAMPPGVSPVTAIEGGPPVSVGPTNFDIPGPQAIPEGGAGDPLTLRMQGSLGQGPTAVPGGVGGIGDVNALAGTPMQIPARWTPADPRSILSTLNSVEAQALQRLGQTKPVNLSDEQWQLLQDWFQAVRSQTNEAKLVAGQVGAEARNFALLNYGDKRNLDMALGVTHPYHYWYGRTYANWMKRAVLNPNVMANYGRYRQALEQMHAALPEYYRQQLSTDDLGLDLETPLMFNLEQTMSPLYGLLGSDFTDPTRRRAQLFGAQGAGAWVEDAGALGPAPWAPISWAVALSSFAGGDPDAGNAWMNNYLGSLPRTIRAATALAGVGPAGGVNLDPQMLLAGMISGNGLSVQGMTQWERNRVATLIAGYGDNPPPGVDPQDWRAQVAEAAYTQSGPLWDKAMQEMFVGTAPAVLTSFFAGLGFKGRSETEAEVGQVYSELAKLRANSANMTPEQIQQAYLDLQRRNPIYELLMLSRASGPQRDDAWVWEAMGRVGLGDREAWAAAGVSEAALDAFFANKTTEGLAPELLAELLAGASTINRRNRPPSLEEQQRQLDADVAYDAIKAQIEAQFPADAFLLEDEFFRIREEQGSDTANAWMENLEPTRQALLRELLDARTEAKMNAGPDVQRYFIDPERYEAMLVGQYYDQAEVDRPGIRQLSSDYWALRDSGDFGAAALLLKENPQLKEYWDETAAFKAGVRGEVLKWLATLPPTTQGQERADFDPQGMNESKLDEHYQQQADARLGVYDSPYGDNGQPTGAVSPTADAYRVRYEAEQAAKLAAQEGRQTYLNSENKLAYTDNYVLPLYRELGSDPVALAEMLDYPLAQDWPAAAGGVAALLAMVGDAESVREGLFAYAGQKGNADWVRYVALLRNMDDAQLDALRRKYPQLSDAVIVAQQARAYELPTQNALHDILGFSVSIGEDGYVSINRQTVKKDKKKGTYGLDTQGGGVGNSGGASRGGAGGGAFGGGSTSRRTNDRFASSGGGWGGGGGRGGSGGGAAEAAPDPVAEQMATWVNFALTLKQDQPDMLRMLMDFFDMPDDYARQAILMRYPALAQYLQTLGGEKLAQLAEAYYTWRQDQQDAQAPVSASGKRQTGPRIQRYYKQRPTTTGLQ